jgi:hypothetical protein
METYFQVGVTLFTSTCSTREAETNIISYFFNKSEDEGIMFCQFKIKFLFLNITFVFGVINISKTWILLSLIVDVISQFNAKRMKYTVTVL